MANVRAFRAGNWNDTSTSTSPWANAGTLYAPATGDVVYANSFTIQMNVTTPTGLTLSTAASSSITFKDGATTTATAGGGFNVSTAGITINANIQAGTSNALTCSLSSGGTFTINGNCTGSSTTGNPAVVITGNVSLVLAGNCTGASGGSGGSGLSFGSSGTISVTGTATGGSASAGNCFGITITNASTTGTITGNITGGSNNSTANDGVRISAGTATITGTCTGGSAVGSSAAVGTSGSGNVVINGDVVGGGGGSSNGHGLNHNSTGTAVINGNVTGGTIASTYGVYNQSSSGSVTINGTATASDLAAGAWNNAAGTLNVTRAKGNGYGYGSVGKTSQPGVSNAVTGVCTVKEIEFGSLGQSPVSGVITLIDATSNVAIFYKSSGTKTLVDGSASGLMPAASDVRFGTSYNSGNSTGTLRVPAAGSVALGVSVDNTTGTAVLTPANVWDYSLSSASGASGSVGEKLKKTSNTSDLIALG